ncbi:hypothetical protein [Pseudomonas sp. NFR16]|uniref:hypothetical protein n=1 Tax=Pseudomonas sp. NFR16 TaxID=1566248 RepID=UPI000B82BC3A|nr:hypothetical protein [Pseudomonas sp. NFR16]
MKFLTPRLAHHFKLLRRFREQAQGEIVRIGVRLIDGAQIRRLRMPNATLFNEKAAGLTAEARQFPLQLYLANDEGLEHLGWKSGLQSRRASSAP